jgi:hypothetical protein
MEAKRMYGHGWKKMDPEAKELWIEALRSGKFKQGKRALKTYDGAFCCLGVLCEVTGNGYYEHTTNDTGAAAFGIVSKVFPDSDHLTTAMSLPAELQDILGVDKTADAFLQSCNDDYDWTFAQIADWIEENL